jgi:transcriptional regulator with XRE-family HTH domain
MDLCIIGKNIRKKRLALGYTQEKLAEIADCSWRYIPAIEQGLRIPSLKWLNQLSESLNIPLTDFFQK